MDVVKQRVREATRATWPVAVALATGLCWGRSTAYLAFIPFVLVALCGARSRVEAWLVGTIYHLAAARSLALAATRFFQASPWLGVLAVAMSTGLVGLFWAACWSKRMRSGPLAFAAARIFVLLLVPALPALGVVGVAHPLHAAGVLCPGLGWWGLCVVFALMLVSRSRAGAAFLGGWALAAFVGWRVAGSELVPRSQHVQATHTTLELGEGTLDFAAQWMAAQQAIQLVRASRASILALPENVGGLWQEPMQRLWAPLEAELKRTGRVVLLGAALPRADGDFDNAVLTLGATSQPYLQRVPIPFAMWRPWSEGQGSDVFHAHFFGRGVREILGRKLGLLVCFEASLLGVVLASIAQGAEELVAIANAKWLRGTSAVNAQRQSLESLGALFELPVSFAVNQ